MVFAQPLLDVADLVLGRRCLACGTVGRELCASCLLDLRSTPYLEALATTRTPVWIGATYESAIRTMLLAYKDGQRSLARPLGSLLADVVAAAVAATGQRAGFLVRVPGHRRPARGFDALGLVVRHASIELRRRGVIAPDLGVLARRRDHLASKGLGRDERRLAVEGAFIVKPSRACVGLPRHLPVIVVDDVMTSGATLAEAVRALTESHLHPTCAAVIASAPRRADQPGYVGDDPRTRSSQEPPADS